VELAEELPPVIEHVDGERDPSREDEPPATTANPRIEVGLRLLIFGWHRSFPPGAGNRDPVAHDPRRGVPVELIKPHFSKPPHAPSPLGAEPVKFTLNDDDDDDDLDIDVGHMTTSQKIGLGALILGGVLVSRGKIKPSTMMRIIKIGGGMAFKAGLLGLVQQGGHAPGEDASKPPRIQGRPGSLLPAGPADPNTADPVK